VHYYENPAPPCLGTTDLHSYVAALGDLAKKAGFLRAAQKFGPAEAWRSDPGLMRRLAWATLFMAVDELVLQTYQGDARFTYMTPGSVWRRNPRAKAPGILAANVDSVIYLWIRSGRELESLPFLSAAKAELGKPPKMPKPPRHSASSLAWDRYEDREAQWMEQMERHRQRRESNLRLGLVKLISRGNYDLCFDKDLVEDSHYVKYYEAMVDSWVGHKRKSKWHIPLGEGAYVETRLTHPQIRGHTDVRRSRVEKRLARRKPRRMRSLVTKGKEVEERFRDWDPGAPWGEKAPRETPEVVQRFRGFDPEANPRRNFYVPCGVDGCRHNLAVSPCPKPGHDDPFLHGIPLQQNPRRERLLHHGIEPGGAARLGSFLSPHQMQLVTMALRQGRLVEVETSSFTDPGPDYTNVLIDGKVVATIPGY
jgi:hypothetical protein